MYPEPPELPWQAAMKYHQQASNLWDCFKLRLIQMLWSLIITDHKQMISLSNYVSATCSADSEVPQDL